jgi:tetratricopeptide (TPR) repeat protein
MLEEALRGGHPSSIRALLIDYRDRVLLLHPRKGTTGWGAALCGFGYNLYQSGDRLRDPVLLLQAESVLKEALVHETAQFDTGHVQILYYLALTRSALGVIQAESADFEGAISAIENALNLNPRMFLDQINVALGQAHLGLALTGGGAPSAETALLVFERVPITRTSSGLYWAHQCIAIAEARLIGQSWTATSLAETRKSVNGALSYYRSRQRECWFMPHWMERAEAVRERVRAVKPP